MVEVDLLDEKSYRTTDATLSIGCLLQVLTYYSS